MRWGSIESQNREPRLLLFRSVYLTALLACLALPAWAQHTPTSRPTPWMSAPAEPHVFGGDLRDLPKASAPVARSEALEIPKRQYPRPSVAPEPGPPAPEAALAAPAPLAPMEVRSMRAMTQDLSFAGIGATGVVPPDTVGDVGPSHYIQMVNAAGGAEFVIFDKTGMQLAGPTRLDTLGSGNCASGHGDPVVLWDSLASRWLMSEFSATANRLCVYVSQTADPISGGWYAYEFTTPEFPDYPKYGVWPDAYYVSSNESSPAVYALDRTQMLAGAAATLQRFTGPSLAGFPFQAFIPSDIDGTTAPPAGAPNYFARHRDDEVHNGSPNPAADFVEIWEFHVDFTTPANSTFTGPLNVPVAEFDSNLCGLVSFACFPQPGTATTLDPIREVVMWRLQYRNFGSHQTLVGNFVTDVATDQGGIRWFELRKSGVGSWTLHQEGTYSPDATNRWLGSIAMDGDGNIALGYSVSSSSVSPGIRYTGRLAGDALGTLPEPEATLIAGAGSQTGSTRWGDYSALSVDPSDDCSFWYTNEYYAATSGAGWATRIGKFKFSSCGTPPVDTDGDGVADSLDNCVEVANADQRDTNLDGYGNRCDTDLDNNNATGISDFGLFRDVFGDTCSDPFTFCDDADFTGDEVVGIPDFGIFRPFFGDPPGPSGLACAGSFPCPATACSHDLCTLGATLHMGCSDCAEAICDADPFCCETAWDGSCVAEVLSVCGSNECAPPACDHGVCDQGGPLDQLCDACVATICLADPFCCNTAWDSICVGEVYGLCGSNQCLPPCAHDVCEVGAGLDAACDPGCVASICSADPICCTDAWDAVCVGEVETICGSTQCCPHDICTTGDALAPACNGCTDTICQVDSFCCTDAWDSICVGEVESVCGSDECCPHDVCSTGDPLAPACDSCSTSVCAADPYCCETAWDSVCVDEVQSACGLDCACSHDVCIPGAALASSCNACTASVCTVDSYCCDTAWDETCVDEAGSICGTPCGSASEAPPGRSRVAP